MSFVTRLLYDILASERSVFLIHRKYGLDIKDFGPSWRDGLAFNAIIHSINPGLVNMDELQFKTARDNLEDAFRKAEEHLGIPRLLDPEGIIILKNSVETSDCAFL